MTTTKEPFFLPQVYCASKLHRHAMWRSGIVPDKGLTVVSTWHNNPDIEIDELDQKLCRDGWAQNFIEIRQADVVVAYGEFKDRLNGTLIEIGYALARRKPVYLVGNYDWGTWKYHPFVKQFPTIHQAFEHIIGAFSK